MRFCEIAFSSVVRTCSWLISSANVCGPYLRAMTWYMQEGRGRVYYAKPRVIRGTRVKPLPLLPSGPGGVCSRPLHEARSLTNYKFIRCGPGKLGSVEDSSSSENGFFSLTRETVSATFAAHAAFVAFVM